MKKLDKAGEILKKLSIFNNSENSNAENYSSMFKSWEYIVGTKLAGYSRILNIDNNSLIVEADHPAIIQLLQVKYSEILFKLNKKYKELKIIDIRIILKDPEIIYNNKNKYDKMAGDNDKLHKKSKEYVDINSIDNENFKDLLLKMKKRSQV
ncbi:MAG: DUF721 domain-containing protein [Spirochaetaceae bacterium]|nr:DUF721 domain-containing protein [Spirochaetaceae bacterium]